MIEIEMIVISKNCTKSSKNLGSLVSSNEICFSARNRWCCMTRVNNFAAIVIFNMIWTLHKNGVLFIKSKKMFLKKYIFTKTVGIPKLFDKIATDMDWHLLIYSQEVLALRSLRYIYIYIYIYICIYVYIYILYYIIYIYIYIIYLSIYIYIIYIYICNVKHIEKTGQYSQN